MTDEERKKKQIADMLAGIMGGGKVADDKQLTELQSHVTKLESEIATLRKLLAIVYDRGYVRSGAYTDVNGDLRDQIKAILP